MAIHEVKEHLSSVIAQLSVSGEDVEITRHGRVVAVLAAPRSSCVTLGLGAHHVAPSLDDLRWSECEICEVLSAPTLPS